MRNITFSKELFYHLYNRGVDKRTIFQSDNDRWRFLQALLLFNDENVTNNLLWQLEREKGKVNFTVLREFLAREGKERKPLVRIFTDCLMPNHFHLILKGIQDDGISRFMHKLGTGYTNYFNKKYDRAGSLFQGTFKAVPIETDLYLQHLLIYINVINPGQLLEPNLKEQGVKDVGAVLNFARNFQWSTHPEYAGLRDSIIIDDELVKHLFESPQAYEQFAKGVLIGRSFEAIDHLLLE